MTMTMMNNLSQQGQGRPIRHFLHTRSPCAPVQCKSATAHRVNRLRGVAGPVWEEESFDHVLRSDESFAEKCEYIRQNAVEAGRVARAEDYPWLWVEAELR